MGQECMIGQAGKERDYRAALPVRQRDDAGVEV